MKTPNALVGVLMKNLAHKGAGLEDLQRGHQVLAALTAEKDEDIRRALQQAQNLGVSLPQVGSLALYVNRPHVGRVLKDFFGVEVKDYCTTGEEARSVVGVGHPLPLYMAHAHENELLARALEWGLDPNQTWDAHLLPVSTLPNRGVSLVSQAIASLNSEGTLVLLKAAQTRPPVEREEEMARMRALGLPFPDQKRNSFSGKRKLLKLLGPEGLYPLKASPWDVVDEDTTQAEVLVGRMQTHPTHTDEGAVWKQFLPWIQATAPQEGYEVMVDYCLAKHHPLPQWAVDKLTCDQAASLVPFAWLHAAFSFHQHAASKAFERNEAYFNVVMMQSKKPWLPLATQARREDPDRLFPMTHPLLFLHRLDYSDTNPPSPHLLALLIRSWPNDERDENHPAAVLADLQVCSQLVHDFSKIRPDALGAAQKSALGEARVQMKSIFESARLMGDTPAAPSVARRPRL